MSIILNPVGLALMSVSLKTKPTIWTKELGLVVPKDKAGIGSLLSHLLEDQVSLSGGRSHRFR